MPARITDYASFVSDELQRLQPPQLTIERLSRTRLLVSFEANGRIARYRLLMFAVGETGRGRPDERRVEITSTYLGGLERDPTAHDVVLGVERDDAYLVGIDAGRLHHGGPTSNASTFVYTPGFDALKKRTYDAILNPSTLIPDERQVYIRPSFLIEYLGNVESLHRFGIVARGAGPATRVISPDDPDPPSNQTRLSFEDQVRLAMLKIEVGQAGERLALARERSRLIRTGKVPLADRVNWISQTRPFVGYDIASFTNLGAAQAVEVKSSTGAVNRFFISNNELKVAEKKRQSYTIVCVSNVFANPTFQDIIDPVTQISTGALIKISNGYVITL